MKSCITCHSTFPAGFTHCPHDGSVLTETSEWKEGSLIRGKYRILGKLGQGGMATVYKAQHVRFEEVCALKVISPELASDAAFVRRFGQEAVVTRRLQHPNAVRVEDIDQADDGRPFIVMEYIEGESLKDLIQRLAPIPVARVCRIATQVAAALDAAHRLGLVHRDIKPGNIILTHPAEGGEQAKVLDFGIAKIKEAHASASGATLTRTGMSIGTPAYMSPEQAMGKTGDALDGRADLYSLGIVMYEMLTGELPIKADSEVQMLMAQIGTAPEPIRTRHPEIPIRLAGLVMNCLEKDPAARPPDAASLRQQIEDFEAVAAQPDSPTRRTVPPAQATVVSTAPVIAEVEGPPAPSGHPSRWLLWAAVLLVLAVIAGGAAWYLQPHQSIGMETPVTSHAPVTAQTPATVAPANPTQVPYTVTARPTTAAKPPAATAMIPPPAPPPPDDDDSGPPEDAASDMGPVHSSPVPDAALSGLWKQGNQLLKQGNYTGAAAVFQSIVALRPEWAAAYRALGIALANQADYSGAVANERKALELDPKAAVTHRALGRALARNGDLQAAIAEYQAAIKLKPKMAMSHHDLGEALGKSGNLDADIREQLQALHFDPSMALAHSHLGYLYMQKGDWDQALKEFREAIRLNPMIASAHYQHAKALEHQGQLQDALEEYRRAVALDSKQASYREAYEQLAKRLNSK